MAKEHIDGNYCVAAKLEIARLGAEARSEKKGGRKA
jgi:hypothetical protein